MSNFEKQKINELAKKFASYNNEKISKVDNEHFVNKSGIYVDEIWFYENDLEIFSFFTEKRNNCTKRHGFPCKK